VFGNIEQQITPLGNSSANIELSQLVIRMWTAFAYNLDPNDHGCECSTSFTLSTPADQFPVPDIDLWPQYGESASNFVFRLDKSYIEKDDDRTDGVTYINTLVR
jgi:hypothetical protein